MEVRKNLINRKTGYRRLEKVERLAAEDWKRLKDWLQRQEHRLERKRTCHNELQSRDKKDWKERQIKDWLQRVISRDNKDWTDSGSRDARGQTVN